MGHDVWEIHLYPLERRWQVHAVGTGIKPGSEVHNHIRSVLNRTGKKLIEKIGPCHPCPLVFVAVWQRVRELESMLPRQAFGERITKQRVGPLRFNCTKISYPTSGVGNTPNAN